MKPSRLTSTSDREAITHSRATETMATASAAADAVATTATLDRVGADRSTPSIATRRTSTGELPTDAADHDIIEDFREFANTRRDQSEFWRTALDEIERAGLTTHDLASLRKTSPAGRVVLVDVREFRAEKGSANLGPNDKTMLLDATERALSLVASKGLESKGLSVSIDLAYVPQAAAQLRQQSMVALHPRPLGHILIATDQHKKWEGGLASQSIAGSVAEDVAGFAEASIVHEIGHTLHAVNDPEMFLPSSHALSDDGGGAADLSKRVGHANQALLNSIVRTVDSLARWGYGLANPAELVAECFTALLYEQPVPHAIAALYVAFGGPRSTHINGALGRCFQGPIPRLRGPAAAKEYVDLLPRRSAPSSVQEASTST